MGEELNMGIYGLILRRAMMPLAVRFLEKTRINIAV